MRKWILILFLVSLGLQAKPPSFILYKQVHLWFWGKADSVTYYYQYSHPQLIQNIIDAHHVKTAREYWYNKNLDSFKNGKQNWLNMTQYLGKFSRHWAVLRAGTDMVEQTIGSFIVNITPIGKDSIHFRVRDVKSRNSLFLHIPFIKNIKFDSNRKRQKLMSNVEWVFEWTEPIYNFLFLRRELNMVLQNNTKFLGRGF